MKPSDVKRRPAAERERPKAFKASQKANPPISAAEVKRAGVSNCPSHGGLIAMTGDVDGSVHYCVKGGQYWRYKKPDKGDGPLPVPDIGMIRQQVDPTRQGDRYAESIK